jgi:acetoin utilization deacetylase AcuC-like enzyme
MGDAAGLGYNLNLPMPRGTADDEYLQTLGNALERIASFQPGALVVALGLDAHESDPFQGFAVTTEGFRRIGAHIGAANYPTLIVQEGGYLSDALGDNLAAFLSGFMNIHGN